MSPLEKQAYIKKIYGLAVAAGLLRKISEFADALEVDRSGLSSAMNGNERNLSDRLVRKVEKWAKLNGLDGEPLPVAHPPVQEQRGVFIPEETLALYTNLSETCRNLSAIVAQMQAGAVPYMGVSAPKNLRTEK